MNTCGEVSQAPDLEASELELAHALLSGKTASSAAKRPRSCSCASVPTTSSPRPSGIWCGYYYSSSRPEAEDFVAAMCKSARSHLADQLSAEQIDQTVEAIKQHRGSDQWNRDAEPHGVPVARGSTAATGCVRTWYPG